MADYKDLGIALKAYRVAANESIDELSIALEVDAATISKIENGALRPKPSIIELMARHFTLRDQEAKRLLELAGYGKNEFSLDLDTDFKIEDLEKDIEIMINPVFYTDTVNVVSNQYGVVINFVQSTTSDGKPIVISRVGMSHQHAKSVIKVLEESLKRANQNKKNKDADKK